MFHLRKYKAIVGYRNDEQLWEAVIWMLETLIEHWFRFVPLKQVIDEPMLRQLALTLADTGLPFPVIQAFVIDLVRGNIEEPGVNGNDPTMFQLYGTITPQQMKRAFKLWDTQKNFRAKQRADIEARKILAKPTTYGLPQTTETT
jgi:hypothetical protein